MSCTAALLSLLTVLSFPIPNEADGVKPCPFVLQWDLPHHEAWVVHDSDL